MPANRVENRAARLGFAPEPDTFVFDAGGEAWADRRTALSREPMPFPPASAFVDGAPDPDEAAALSMDALEALREEGFLDGFLAGSRLAAFSTDAFGPF